MRRWTGGSLRVQVPAVAWLECLTLNVSFSETYPMFMNVPRLHPAALTPLSEEQLKALEDADHVRRDSKGMPRLTATAVVAITTARPSPVVRVFEGIGDIKANAIESASGILREAFTRAEVAKQDVAAEFGQAVAGAHRHADEIGSMIPCRF